MFDRTNSFLNILRTLQQFVWEIALESHKNKISLIDDKKSDSEKPELTIMVVAHYIPIKKKKIIK